MQLFGLILGSIVLFSIIGISSASATVCYEIYSPINFGNGVVFLGTVKSIETEMHDEIIYPSRDNSDYPYSIPDPFTIYGDGVEHIVFDVHQKFKGKSYDKLSILTRFQMPRINLILK